MLAWARELVDSGALADLPLSRPIYVDERTSVQVRPNGALDVQHRGKLMSPKFWNVSNASKLVNALSDEILGRLVERIESGRLWRDIARLAERRERGERSARDGQPGPPLSLSRYRERGRGQAGGLRPLSGRATRPTPRSSRGRAPRSSASCSRAPAAGPPREMHRPRGTRANRTSRSRPRLWRRAGRADQFAHAPRVVCRTRGYELVRDAVLDAAASSDEVVVGRTDRFDTRYVLDFDLDGPKGRAPGAGSRRGPEQVGAELERLREIDEKQVWLARSNGRMRLRLGEMFEKFVGQQGHRELGFSTTSAYSLERLSRPGRWMGEARTVARHVAELPRLRRAFDRGEFGWSKLELPCRHATAETEC